MHSRSQGPLGLSFPDSLDSKSWIVPSGSSTPISSLQGTRAAETGELRFNGDRDPGVHSGFSLRWLISTVNLTEFGVT